jgi:hypothetical protein
MRLVPTIPFVLGGTNAHPRDHLGVRDVDAMGKMGALARQIRHMAEGSEVTFDWFGST